MTTGHRSVASILLYLLQSGAFSVTIVAGATLLVADGVGRGTAGEPAAVADGEANWAQWRGPEGQGVSAESAVPSQWSPSQNVAWKVAVEGRGHSSPIVWGNRVFLTTAVEGPVVPGAKAPVHMNDGKEFLHPDSMGADHRHTYKLTAFDLTSGKLVWERTAYDGPVYDNRHKRGSYASPTPVTDGKRVYAYFGSEGIYAYDFSGKLAWKADIGDIATVGMGTASSPVLYRQLVILQCDEDNGERSFIVALDTRTGKEVWRTPRKVQVSWTTPVIVQVDGHDELVASGAEWIVAYDPATGKELWKSKGLESNAIHTPLVGHGLVIATAGYPKKRVIAIRPGGKGDITGTDRVVWTYDKGTAYVASPILYGDYAYLLSDNGTLTCLDAKTGQVKYEGGRVPKPGRVTASSVAFEGKILLTNEDGDTFVVKAGPTHEVLGTNTVDEPVMATPAISQGRILIRAARHLYCIKAGATATAP
jgi:outer membrane protein assembly factor BamB